MLENISEEKKSFIDQLRTVKPIAIGIGFAAAVGFIMTSYTTGRGVHSFMPDGFAWIGVSFIAVIFLFLTSYFFGDALRERKFISLMWIIPLYITAVAICWVFSFASYHSQFLGGTGSDLADTETRLAEMMAIPLPLKRASDEVFDKAVRDLRSDPSFTTYLEELGDFDEQINKPSIKREISSEIEKIRENRAKENRESRQDLIQSKESATLELSSKKSSLDSLNKDLQILSQSIKSSEDRVRDLRKALAEEQYGPSGEPQTSSTSDIKVKLAANGLASTLISDQACREERSIGTSRNTYSCYQALQRELEITEGKLVKDKSRRGDIQGKIELASYDVEHAELALKNAEERLADMGGGSESSPINLPPLNLRTSIETLTLAPSAKTFELAATECETVARVITSAIPGTNAVPDCRPQKVVSMMAGLQKIETARSIRENACEGNPATQEIILLLRKELADAQGRERISVQARAFDNMRKEVITPCFDAADAMGIDTSGLRSSFTSFLDRNNPSQDELSKAAGKIHDLLTGAASARDYLPALIALLQELALLGGKLFWEQVRQTRKGEPEDLSDLDLTPHETDSALVSAAKLIIDRADHDKHGLLLREGYDEDYSPQMRGQIGRILGGFERKKLATRDKIGVRVFLGGMSELAEIIRRHQQAEMPPQKLTATYGKVAVAPTSARNPQQSSLYEERPIPVTSPPSVQERSDPAPVSYTPVEPSHPPHDLLHIEEIPRETAESKSSYRDIHTPQKEDRSIRREKRPRITDHPDD